MENSTEGGLKGGALSTLEAMVVSMGFMAPSVALFSNKPFIAGFAGGTMPSAMPLSSQEDARGAGDRGTSNPADY